MALVLRTIHRLGIVTSGTPVARGNTAQFADARIAIYPDVKQDGIGTYVRWITSILGIEAISSEAGILSVRQFIGGLPAGFDLIHVPHFVVPMRRNSGRLVCTIHDIVPVLAPAGVGAIRSRYLRFRIGWSLRQADHIIFTSESSRLAVEKIFGPVRRFSVIPLAAEPALPTDSLPATAYDFPFFLSVGRRRYHKNIDGMLKALAVLSDETACHLVFVGRPDVQDARWKALARELGVVDRVHFTGALSREELAAHYLAAVCLLFPSRYEGFGLPILEAMTYGCPVITSNRSSMPEVAGDAAVLVDPEDPTAIAQALRRVANDRGLRDDLIARGRERSRLFSWENTARATAAVYGSVLAGGVSS